MRQFVCAVLLMVLVLGSHGAFLELSDNELPLVFTAGTSGFGGQYIVGDSRDVFFRLGLSFGTNGVSPAATLGYRFGNEEDKKHDLRIGFFNETPFVGIGLGF